MDDLYREVRREIYRGFVEDGLPPAPNALAATLGVPQIDVERTLHRMADDHMVVLAPGTPYVWMANPFSAIPTPFEVASGDARWWGNCIWDAMGILAATHASEGGISTACPDCGEPMRLELADGTIRGTGVVHFAIPAARWWEDIGFN